MAGQRHTQNFDDFVSDNKIVKTKPLIVMTQPELGKKIVQLRKAKGLTQEELVDKCNISVRTIQRIEAGEVTPRSYTIKTILEALDHNFSDITFENEYDGIGISHWIKRQFLIGVDFQSPSGFVIQQLKIAWLFGAIYFILGFFEGSADFIRYSENRLIFSQFTYILIKTISFLALTLYFRGFIIAGGVFKNYLLSGTAVIIIFAVLLTTLLEISSLYDKELYSESTIGAMGITFGVLGIIFGIALIRLRKNAGELALAAGLFQMLVGIFFMTLVLSFVGYIILIPAELCSIILIYKIVNSTNLKRSMRQTDINKSSPQVSL